ncbi:uncharacterized protein FOMMEDRAFT_149783 [Fomitiporia mediterranea MF3/22]|uniref:uncharacterized protein n=1 Tax=Fomitiporia mediterranea (strain MF3/22) TaxID=694068 RepID=UPI0004409951|nr:uncharacterized protein FOMMEDRAFT_149783 [Fomitiporia mediterranea MF3/22]EJD07270.1 hypothetical protein FOMMEDRAFT_149783 [Fomitiporia mediterranea MF3/22]
MTFESTLQRFLVLIRASRISGWFFGPILHAIGVIHSRVFPKTTVDILRSGFQLFCLSFPLCIIVFGVNDVYDYPSDVRNPRKHEHACRLSTHSPVVFCPFAIINAKFPPSNLNYIHPLSRLAVLLSPSSSQGEAHTGLALQRRPCLVILGTWVHFFRLGAFWGECWREKGWLLAFCTAGVHALGAATDVEADVSAGQRTIATVFGVSLAAGCSAALYLPALTTVESISFVGVYSFVGSAISLVPVFIPEWAH